MSFFKNPTEAPSAETCLLEKRNITVLSSVYEGIPETLLINVVSWILLLVLFSVLRKRAGDYGRLALMQFEDHWTKMFYERENNVSDCVDSLAISDRGWCAWVHLVFHLKDTEIKERCGIDAQLYLSFQRRLMFILLIATILALSVVLPVNFQGYLEGDSTTFGHTTVSNLDPSSSLLWVHIVFAFILAGIIYFVMQRLSFCMSVKERVSRTLLVTGIPPQKRVAGEILHRFRLLFSEYLFEHVEVAHDVTKLTQLTRELQAAVDARVRAEIHLKRTNEHLMVRSASFSGCCSPNDRVNAVDFYRDEEARLLNLVEQERSKALGQPLGIAFVTMSSPEDASFIVANFKSVAVQRDWTVSLAPPPADILWENISTRNEFWYIRALFVDVCLCIALFFLTTPAIVVNTIDSIDIVSKDFETNVSPIVSKFAPTLLLWILSALMPVVVANSEVWLCHWTRSEFNLAVMHKTFVFLLFAVLILPSLGLTSIQAFVEWSLRPPEDPYRWECLFIPDKGAFFVNYVITSALIGTALELLRFSELFVYAWRHCLAKSSAENETIKRMVTYEFPYGVHYSWTLLVFTTSIVYCLICPLITPFGLLYLCLKYAVDRYNLYFAYEPRDTCSDALHATAIRATHISIILLFAVMAGLSILRGGIDNRGGVALTGLVVSIVFSFINCRKTGNSILNDVDSYEANYVAPALRPLDFSRRQSVEDPARDRDYGSSRIESIEAELISQAL